MSTPELAAAALDRLKRLRECEVELQQCRKDNVELRKENVDLKKKVAEVKTHHETAVSDLVAKGKKLEDLVRQIIEDRNRLAAQLVALQSGPLLKASSTQTIADAVAPKYDRWTQSDAPPVAIAVAADPAASPAAPVRSSATVAHTPPPPLLHLVMSPQLLPPADTPIEAAGDGTQLSFLLEPAACLVGRSKSCAATMLTLHIVNCFAERSANQQARIRWVTTSVGTGGMWSWNVSVGLLIGGHGLVDWVRVCSSSDPLHRGVVGLNARGDTIVWVSAAAVALEMSAPPSASCREQLAMLTCNRLHGAFAMDQMNFAVVVQRMEDCGDILLLDGVLGEALVTATSLLGRSRVYLVVGIASSSRHVDGPQRRSASQHSNASGNRCEMASEWLRQEDIAKRYTTCCIVEHWPPFSGAFTEVRLPVAVAHNRCSLVLRPLSPSALQYHEDGVLHEEGGTPSVQLRGIVVSLNVGNEVGSHAHHKCSLVPIDGGRGVFVECETVLDCPVATLILFSDSSSSNVPTLQLMQLVADDAEPVPMCCVVQINGVEKCVDTLFDSVMRNRQKEALDVGCQSVVESMDVSVEAADAIPPPPPPVKQQAAVALDDHREMVRAMVELSNKVEDIERQAILRWSSSLFEMNSIVAQHFLECQTAFGDAVVLHRYLEPTLAWCSSAASAAEELNIARCNAVIDTSMAMVHSLQRPPPPANWTDRLIQWHEESLDLAMSANVYPKGALFQEAVLTIEVATPEAEIPWTGSVLQSFSRASQCYASMWQHALAVATYTADTMTASACRPGAARQTRAATFADASTLCNLQSGRSGVTMSSSAVVAQHCCDVTTWAAQVAMYKEPFFDLLRQKTEASRRSLMLEIAISHKTEALVNCEMEISTLLASRESLSSEILAREAEMEVMCHRMQDSYGRVDELQQELYESSRLLATLQASHHCTQDKHAAEMAAAHGNAAGLGREVQALRAELQALQAKLRAVESQLASEAAENDDAASVASGANTAKAVRGAPLRKVSTTGRR